MKTVVVTGSTRGIGYGLAHEFLARGHQVVVSGRSHESVDKAVAALAKTHGKDRILGQPCDVSQFDQVQALWDAAAKRFGGVDIWINNAGLSNPMHKFWDQDPAAIQSLVNTNLVGVMYGSKVAIAGMLKQGSGQLYNMDGFGSKGEQRLGLLLYGSSKYAVHYLTKGLIAETKDTPVQVSWLSPGIVITDLLMDGYVGTDQDLSRAQKVFNILGDKVETVTPYLVEQILANQKAGAYIAWLTTPKVIFRFMTAAFNKRNLFDSTPPAQTKTSKA
jgi:NAD(P)-dependent dehydrogenase (short-subunit alcohol dehydrogenase family)